MNSENLTIVHGKYAINCKIGKGCFGTIYKGENLRTRERVAIKFERVTGNNYRGALKHETNILNYLCRQGVINIPNVRWYGMANESNESELMPCLVIPFYEKSLHQYLSSISHSDKTLDIRIPIINAMISAIDILCYVHTHSVIHRDIKPDNFMVQGNTVILIDFGMSSIFANDNGIHNIENVIPKQDIVGSPKYISTFIHMGIESSRRDDMISLGYMFMEFTMNDTLWDMSNVETYNNREDAIKTFNPRNMRLLDMKSLDKIECMTTSANCHYLSAYLKECYALRYAESPNYRVLKKYLTAYSQNMS